MTDRAILESDTAERDREILAEAMKDNNEGRSFGPKWVDAAVLRDRSYFERFEASRFEEAFIASALSAMSRARAEERESKWQDIATAPKDNTKVLIYVPPENYSGTDYPAIIMASRFKGYWWDASHLAPTHWQPLPPPPSSVRD